MDAEPALKSTCLASALPVLVLALTYRSLHMPWCSTASLGSQHSLAYYGPLKCHQQSLETPSTTKVGALAYLGSTPD